MSDYDAIRDSTSDATAVLAILNACIIRGGDRKVIERVWFRYVEKMTKEAK